MAGPIKVLFVCAMNRWRSPTAERIYRGDARLSVRSAGLSSKSPHELTVSDLQWADAVLAMERRHVTRIRTVFGPLTDLPPIESLDIPDDFKLMDPELILLLKSGVEQFISTYPGES
jgi:predicted protein tyrosine phosphatase